MLINSTSHITLNHIKVFNHVLERKKYLKVSSGNIVNIKLFRNLSSALI